MGQLPVNKYLIVPGKKMKGRLVCVEVLDVTGCPFESNNGSMTFEMLKGPSVPKTEL